MKILVSDEFDWLHFVRLSLRERDFCSEDGIHLMNASRVMSSCRADGKVPWLDLDLSDLDFLGLPWT